MLSVPDAPTLLAFVLATLLLAITPGPDMTLMLGRTLAAGRRAGLAVIAGTTTGCLMHATLVALGVSALLKASPSAFLALKIAGAFYLLWLAYKAVRYGSIIRIDAKPERRSVWRDYLTGFAVNALNPKIVVFFVSFFPSFVAADDADAAGKLLFLGIVFALVALPIFIPMIVMAEALTQRFTQSRHLARGLDYLFATALAGFALRILTTQR